MVATPKALIVCSELISQLSASFQAPDSSRASFAFSPAAGYEPRNFTQLVSPEASSNNPPSADRHMAFEVEEKTIPTEPFTRQS